MEQSPSVVQEIEELVAADDVRSALAALRDLLATGAALQPRGAARESQREVMLHLAGLTRLERERRAGLVSSDDAERRQARLRAAVLDLVQDVSRLLDLAGEVEQDVPNRSSETLECAEAVTRRSSAAFDEGGSVSDRTNYYVSYAWADDSSDSSRAREAIVDAFCQRARDRGITVKRDKKVMRMGDKISAFMDQLAAGDRVIVVLSDKYLRSPFCMYELYQIWLKAQGDETRFRNRVRCLALPDAAIFDAVGRSAYARYWRERYDREARDLTDMGERDRAAHLNMKKFSAHVGDILALVSDTLLPGTIEDLATYGLEDGNT